jgi:hypothetical protein
LGRPGKIKARPNAQVVFENIRKRLKTFENLCKTIENLCETFENIRKFLNFLQALAHLIDFFTGQ